MAVARRELVALLEAWLADARAGELRGVYVLALDTRGEWNDGYCVPEAEDLMLELRSARLRVMRDCNQRTTEH